MDEKSFRIEMLAIQLPHKLTVILQFTEDCAIELSTVHRCMFVCSALNQVASRPLPHCSPLKSYTVCGAWMCHWGDVRALPADLFMIWLLISFTGTGESASQIGPQAPTCEHAHVCVIEEGGKNRRQNALKYAHGRVFLCPDCLRILGTHVEGVCSELAGARAAMLVNLLFFWSGWNHEAGFVTDCVFGPVRGDGLDDNCL